MTREPDFYKKIYQTKFRDNNTQKYQIFGVPIGNARITKKVQIHPEASLIQYHRKSSSICCLSSLASDFHRKGDNGAVSALVNCIE